MRIRCLFRVAMAAILLSLSAFALADEVKITTTVPSEHTVTVDCDAGGSVRVGGVSYRGTARFIVPRFDAFGIEILPDQGYLLRGVSGNWPGGLRLDANGATLERVCADAAIHVAFVLDTVTPPQSPPSAPQVPLEPVRTTPEIEIISEGEADRLYDEYLGTSGSAGDLFILFDKDYVPVDYQLTLNTHSQEEMLAALPPGLTDEQRERAITLLREAMPNTARVVARPDTREVGEGEYEIVTDDQGEPVYSHHNLLLSGGQIAQFADRGIEAIILEQDALEVSVSLAELREGRIAKLLALLYEQGASALEGGLDAAALDALPEVTTWLSRGERPRLTYAMFADARLEIRVTPILRSELTAPAHVETDGNDALTHAERINLGYLAEVERLELGALKYVPFAYRARVFLIANGVEFEITPLLNTLSVSVSARSLIAAGVRESQIDSLALAVIDSSGDPGVDGYAPGTYTTFLDASLRGALPTDAETLRAFAALLCDQYDVQTSGETTDTVRRVTVLHEDRALAEMMADDRIWARAAIGGLYVVAEP